MLIFLPVLNTSVPKITQMMEAEINRKRSQCHILRAAECFCKNGEELLVGEAEVVSMLGSFSVNLGKSKNI